MASNNTVSIDKVKKDFDPEQAKAVFNPFKEDFECLYGGKPVTVPAGKAALFSEPKAAHIAKHLAIKILNDKMRDYLLDNFKGLDEQGREKWRAQIKTFYDRNDILTIAKTLIFSHEVGEAAPKIEVPKTKFEKATELKEKAKAEEKAADEDEADKPVEEKPAKKSKKED